MSTSPPRSVAKLSTSCLPKLMTFSCIFQNPIRGEDEYFVPGLEIAVIILVLRVAAVFAPGNLNLKNQVFVRHHAQLLQYRGRRAHSHSMAEWLFPFSS